MTAITDALNVTAVQQKHVAYVDFLYLNFSTGAVRLCSWDRNYSFGGNNYIGIGQMGSIGTPKDEGAMQASSLEFTLHNISTSFTQYLSDGTEKYFHREVVLYRGWLNIEYALVADPQEIWRGLMDNISINDSAGVADIVVSAENKLNFIVKNIGLQYSSDHQAFVSPGDVFFSEIPKLGKKVVKWGGGLA